MKKSTLQAVSCLVVLAVCSFMPLTAAEVYAETEIKGTTERKVIRIPELVPEEIFSDADFVVAKKELIENLDNLEEKLDGSWFDPKFTMTYGKEGTIATIMTSQYNKHLSLSKISTVYWRNYFAKENEGSIFFWLYSYHKILTNINYSSFLDLRFSDPVFDKEKGIWEGIVTINYKYEWQLATKRVELTENRPYRIEYNKIGMPYYVISSVVVEEK